MPSRLSAGAAQAQSKLEARYSVSLAGIPLGSGTWVIDITADQYTAVANGRTTGLVKLVADGSGSGGSRGTFQGASVAPTGYMANTISDKRTDEVRMVLRGGVVKEVSAEPPLEPSPDRVPVTEAHRKGVVDPMSAAIMPVAGKGDVLAPEACKRKLAIFDGRQRVDIDLVYKRMDQVKADKGYQGPVVVCTVLYSPIAGHRPERDAIKYLIAQRDMEMWLAPIAGTRVLVPFRFSVPTPFGLGVLQATYFVAQPQPTQAARPDAGQRQDAVALTRPSSRRVFLQQRKLQRREDERQRQHAEHLEAHPEIRRLRAPDDLVEHREREEEHRPAQRELAPAFLGQVEHRVEHDREQRLVEPQPAEQDRAEQHVDDGRLHLDEGLVVQHQRERAEHHDDHRRHHRHHGQMAGQRVGHRERDQDRHHEHRGRDEDAGLLARDRRGQQRADERHEQRGPRIGEEEQDQRPHLERELEQGVELGLRFRLL